MAAVVDAQLFPINPEEEGYWNLRQIDNPSASYVTRLQFKWHASGTLCRRRPRVSTTSQRNSGRGQKPSRRKRRRRILHEEFARGSGRSQLTPSALPVDGPALQR